jgi:hypothetical protein
MAGVEPRKLLAEVRAALGSGRGDDLGEQHRDELVEILEYDVSLFSS